MNRPLGTAIGAVALGVLLVACGSSAAKVETSKSVAAGTPSPSSLGAPSKAPTGPPLLIGLVNAEIGSGPGSSPEWRVGEEQAAKYVNTYQSGVDNRPIKLVSCKTDGTPEGSINCANQLVQAHVATVLIGVDLGMDSSIPIYKSANIPAIAWYPYGTASAHAIGEVFTVAPASDEFMIAALETAQKLSKKNLLFLFLQADPSSKRLNSEGQQYAKKLRLNSSTVFYNTNPDWGQLAATVVAKNTDFPILTGAANPDCLGLLPAFRNAGYQGPVWTGNCDAKSLSQLGSQADQTYSYSLFWPQAAASQAPPDVRNDLNVFRSMMANSAYPGGNGPLGFSIDGFAQLMDAVAMLRQVPGNLDAASIKNHLQNVHGRLFMSPLPFNCNGTAWPHSVTCSTGILVTEFKDGKTTIPPFSPINTDELKPTS